MSLSRFAPSLRAQPNILIVQLRSAHHASAPVVPSTVDEKPGFFKKIALRFREKLQSTNRVPQVFTKQLEKCTSKMRLSSLHSAKSRGIIRAFLGTPLPGETQKPKSMFDDIGKDFIAPPLPPMPKDYKEHPERDVVNFPYPYPPKTRMLMLPDSWFTPFHKVTGTSGPYLFFGGVFSFYLNKELWVFEEQGHLLLGWILFYLILSRTLGYRVDKWGAQKYEEGMARFKNIIDDELKHAVEFRKTSAAEAASFTAMQADFPTIFRENLALQLEATYRKNVDKVASELKRRLDYLKEVEDTKQRFERELFLKAIIDGVQNAVDNNEGNIKSKYLDSCIAQLNQLPLAK
ncbi:ATP synthase subunit b [Aphelenchoides bicaudatus]|nr:ATP synthase subunit b [Aphelenchoides bicaudatus]